MITAFYRALHPTRQDGRDARDMLLLLTMAALLIWARVILFDGPPHFGWFLGNIATAICTFVAGGVFRDYLLRKVKGDPDGRTRDAPDL